MRKTRSIILILSVFFLILVPFFWNRGFLRVGGDDGKLYYSFPFEQISSYKDSLVSVNLAGSGSYFPIQLNIPFLGFIGLIKVVFPFLDTQSFLFGINLALGFFFFYKLLGLFLKDDGWDTFFIKQFSSIFYIFSTFSFYTVWSLQLFSVYLVSIFPLILYFFFKAVLEDKYFYSVIASLVTFFFSVFLWTTPWLMALIIASFPLASYVFIKNKKTFFKVLIISLSLAALLNFYWLAHFVFAPFSSDKNSGDMVSGVASSQFRAENERVILDVSRNNELMYPMFNLFHKQIQISSHWANYDIYKNWHLKFFFFNLIFLAIIFFGAFYANKSSRYRGLYLTSLVSWVAVLFLFTAHISSWGTLVFLWLNKNVPGFVMFRNMHDKFGLALAFSYAFLLAISLKIFYENINRSRIKRTILAIIFLVTILSAKPFILGEYYENPIWTTKNTYNTIQDFNDDFSNLLGYLKNNHEASRYLWLPMNRAGYTLIQDKNLGNHYYVGTSPLQFLSNTSDFTGLLSFGKYYNYLQELILEKKYDDIGKFMQKMNVKFIIVNHNISPDLQKSYFFKTSGELYGAQQGDFLDIILGEKVRDFGNRYSLYKINDRFANEKIYTTDTIERVPHDFSQVSYKKVASYQYEIKVSHLKEKRKLVFLDPYHKLWELNFKLDNTTFIKGSHDLVFDYANGWVMDPENIKQIFPEKYYQKNSDGSIDLDLVLYFEPEKYIFPGALVSGITLLGCLAYLGYNSTKRAFRNGNINESESKR